MRHLRPLALLALALAPATATGAAPRHPRTATLAIRGFAYHPATLHLRRGTTVRVINRDTTDHSFTSRSGRFELPDLAPGRSGTVRFARAGTYHYFCAFHAFMTGAIVVR